MLSSFLIAPALYVLSLVLIAYFTRKQGQGDAEYFLAGRRVAAFPAMFAVVANETSVATVMIFPAAGFSSDFELIWLCLGYIAGRGLVALFFMRGLYDRFHLSIYETIGGTRTGSVPLAVSYIFAKYLANGARYYMAGYAMHQLFGWSVAGWILVIGGLVTIYSISGGLKAVVITDQVHGAINYGVGLLICALLAREIHASPEPFTLDLRWINTNASLSNPNYFLTLFFGGLVLSVATHGADQDMIQRVLATKNARAASRSIFYSGFAALAVIATYLAVGILLRKSGHAALEKSSPLVDYVRNLDLPLAAGFFAVLIVSTGMSSLDSAMNSIGAIWKFVFRSEKSGALWSVFSLGCLVVSALIFARIGREDFLSLALGSMSYIHGGLIAVLITYTFLPSFISPASIVAGIAAGLAATIGSHFLSPVPAFSVQIMGAAVAATTACLAVGSISRRISP